MPCKPYVLKEGDQLGDVNNVTSMINALSAMIRVSGRSGEQKTYIAAKRLGYVVSLATISIITCR